MSPRNPTFELSAWVSRRQVEVDSLLDARLPAPSDDPGRLIEAVRYSLLAPGKRLRPLLGLAAAEAVGAELTPSVRIATAAIELVHCYSLIHDDLPAMDDDDMRRGRPTNHKVYGEAVAILCGDGLLTLAFQWIAEASRTASQAPETAYLEAVRVLAEAAGLAGMVRGQARDVADVPPSTVDQAELLHAEKTGALFRAAVDIGALVGGADAVQRQALRGFAERYGVAFQHADDLEDGEHAGLANEARQRLVTLTDAAVFALSDFGPGADPLRAMAQSLAAKARKTAA